MSVALAEATNAMPKRVPVVMNIIQFPDARLKTVSMPVVADIVNDEPLQNLMDDMVATMMRARAAGLAAIQVGVALRVLVVVDDEGNPHKVINPTITAVSQETETTKEGCLSFLGLFINVKRPREVVVSYTDERGERKTLKGSNQLARAIQHEIDHLDGKTFLDRVSNAERIMALNKNKLAKRRIKQTVKKLQPR